MTDNVIRLYNPNDKPFGLLSNNSYHPITIDGKKYSTVTNYIFSNMLINPSNKNLLQNAEITGSSGANQELLTAINYIINLRKPEMEKKVDINKARPFKDKLEKERDRRISFLSRMLKKDRSYYEKMSDRKINKRYSKLKLKQQQPLMEDEEIEKTYGYLAEVTKEDKDKIKKQDEYKLFISREIKAPFEFIDLEKLKEQIIYEAELNKMGIYKIMDKAVNQELYETIFKAIKDGFTERILGEVTDRQGVSVLRFPEIKESLIATGNRPIQYESQDIFLGVGIDGKGANIVGKVLMQIRHNIKINDMIKKRSKQEEYKKKHIYNTYIAYIILTEEIDKNKNSLIEYLGLTPEQIISKYGLSNITKGIPSQETVMQMYVRCNLNEIVMKEIFQPGTLIINVRKFGMRNLQSSLKKYKKDIIFNSYLEYMIKRKFEDNIEKETEKSYNIKQKLYDENNVSKKWKRKNTKPDRNQIKNEIIQHAISQQTSKIPYNELEKIRERLLDLFKLGMLSASLSDKIDADIEKLNIPTDQEVDDAEIAEIPPPTSGSKISHCDSTASESSGESSGNVEESDEVTKYLKTILGSEKTKSKKEMIKTIIKIQGGVKEDYNDMSSKELKRLINSVYTKQSQQKDKEVGEGEEDSINFVKPDGVPVRISIDDNDNLPEYRPFNPLFYTGILNIDRKNYPTIQHYMICKLIASTGTKRNSIQDGISYDKGMGINAAHELILIDNKLSGTEPEHYKNLQLAASIYDEEERNTNKLLTSLLTVTALNKKFEDRELQNLLITTGDSIIEWASPYMIYQNLVIGTDESKGENYVGVTMMHIREKVKETRSNEDEVFIKPQDINKFVESDAMIKEWVIMRVKDMCGTINKLQQYLKIKDKFDYDLQHDIQIIKLVNFGIDKIYQPCNYLISLAKENESLVPSFIVDIVSKCSGMSTGEKSIRTMDASGQVLYNKQIQEKINENTSQINKLESEFWGGIKTEHSKEETKEFEKHQRDAFHQLWDEINSSDMSAEEKNKEVEIFKKVQQDEYNEFWGVKVDKKTKDDISRHEHSLQELRKELSSFLVQAKTRENHYFLIIKEISQLYWNRLAAMLSVLIQNLGTSSTGSNIRDILVKVQLLNSEPSKCDRIISNEANNCIVSAILNLMTGIILFKEEFSLIKELDTDDVKLAGSIIINTKFQPVNINEDDNEDDISQFDVGEEGFFPEDDDEFKKELEEEFEGSDYGEIEEDSDNLEENPYFGFKPGEVNNKKRKIGKKSIVNDKDIKAIEMKLILMSKNTKNYNEIAIEIMKMVNIIKDSNMSQKIKQNRINFFATIR